MREEKRIRLPIESHTDERGYRESFTETLTVIDGSVQEMHTLFLL